MCSGAFLAVFVNRARGRIYILITYAAPPPPCVMRLRRTPHQFPGVRWSGSLVEIRPLRAVSVRAKARHLLGRSIQRLASLSARARSGINESRTSLRERARRMRRNTDLGAERVSGHPAADDSHPRLRPG